MENTKSEPSGQRTLTIHVIRHSQFRAVPASGILLQNAPNGGSSRVMIYCDRIPVPSQSVHEFLVKGNQGVIGKAIKGEQPKNVTELERELQFEIVVTNETLYEIHTQIGKFIEWQQRSQQQSGGGSGNE